MFLLAAPASLPRVTYIGLIDRSAQELFRCPGPWAGLQTWERDPAHAPLLFKEADNRLLKGRIPYVSILAAVFLSVAGRTHRKSARTTTGNRSTSRRRLVEVETHWKRPPRPLDPRVNTPPAARSRPLACGPATGRGLGQAESRGRCAGCPACTSCGSPRGKGRHSRPSRRSGTPGPKPPRDLHTIA